MFGRAFLCAVLMACTGVRAVHGEGRAPDGRSRPIKARVIQPYYGKGEQAAYECLKWELDELAKCDAGLDLIVLPEASDVQALMPDAATRARVVARNHAPLMEACAATAKRCRAIVFANAVEVTPEGQQNVTYAFDRTGKQVGMYRKEHLTPGEKKLFGPAATAYTREWSSPTVLEIEGVRYAFLTCYDFYFYENFANLARMKPDVIIGCSHQRSDPHHVLETIGSFCAYNTAAYLVRASVSMGADSPVGGGSMVVGPDGKILGNLKSKVGVLDVAFDPHAKYRKPAGFGNAPATHPEYVERGRCPWKYRPAGGAIVPGLDAAPAKRLCAHRGFSSVAPENSMPAFGAAVSLGAAEIEFDLWWTKDGEIVSLHDATLDRVSDGAGKVFEKTYDELRGLDFGVKRGQHFGGLRIVRFEDILRKFSCQVLMNIHLKSLGDRPWKEEHLRRVIDLIDAYDARRHVYFMTSSGKLHDQIARLAPDIVRCMGNGDFKDTHSIVEAAIAHKCQMVQLFKPYFDRSTVEKAHAAGIRCNAFWSDDPEEARRFLAMGVDTILTNDYQPVAAATGLR